MKTSIILLAVLCSCNPLYKAGNLKELGYSINTPLRMKIVRRYMDTLIAQQFSVPDKWKQYDKLVDIDPTNNKRIYFNENPEEMYLISFQGTIILSDVFNPKIKNFDWVADTSLISKKEKLRIIKRFKTEVLSRIKAMAEKDHVPDTLLYKE